MPVTSTKCKLVETVKAITILTDPPFQAPHSDPTFSVHPSFFTRARNVNVCKFQQYLVILMCTSFCVGGLYNYIISSAIL